MAAGGSVYGDILKFPILLHNRPCSLLLEAAHIIWNNNNEHGLLQWVNKPDAGLHEQGSPGISAHNQFKVASIHHKLSDLYLTESN